MKSRLMVTAFFLLSPMIATAGIGPCDMSYARIAYSGTETLALTVLPDGSGSAPAAARTPYGILADATITLYLRDCLDLPIADYPREDLWLESADGGLVLCPGGTIADVDTDAAGSTTWTTPLRGGGMSESLCLVMINGFAVINSGAFEVRFNSPDMNGDLLVNLSDVPVFVGDFYSGFYHFRSDFSRDGTVNLSDIVTIAQAVGSSCP